VKESFCLTAGARKSKLHAPGRDVLGRKGTDGFVLPSQGGAELRSCTHDSSINFAAAGESKDCFVS